MDDIRLFDTDGDFLVLEAKDGQKYRLLIDDSVRTSLRREPLQKLDEVSITPREIQDEIRNGASITELMDKSGATFEFVEKFAAPVIAELSYVVSSALSVRLTIAGDRYSDSTQVEFGEIIANRLVSSGASAVSWSAKKIDTSMWHVSASYQINGGTGFATWSFDPRRLTLSPENETAQTLSSQETLGNALIPKLRPVDSPAQPLLSETAIIETIQPKLEKEVIPFTNRAGIEPEEITDYSTPAAFKKQPEPKSTLESQSAGEPLSATADLLEALRRKRTERSDNSFGDTELEPHPDTSNIRVIDFEPVVVNDPAEPAMDSEDVATADTEIEPEPEEAISTSNQTKPAAKKGRASMPSWDEIVFGTKAED
jgi:hypothetical protein